MYQDVRLIDMKDMDSNIMEEHLQYLMDNPGPKFIEIPHELLALQ